MQRKLFFMLFFIFIFSCSIKTTFSSKETENENETDKKRKRLPKNEFLNTTDLQNQNTQDTFQNILNFVPPSADHLQSSNIEKRENRTVAFNFLKSKDEKYFYFGSNLLKIQEKEIFVVPSNLLSNLLKTSNLFRFIFPYLSPFELELNFKCTSKTFYHLYEKFLQEEKTFLQSCLTNEAKFLENIKHTRQYFDFFEKRLWHDPKHIEYANVDCFFEHLILLPKSIRQMFSFAFNNIENKYVLFKNGHLSILKQNTEGKFVFTSLEKDFQTIDFPFLNQTFPLDSFQENVRWLDVSGFQMGDLRLNNIDLYKHDNFVQAIRHSTLHPKILAYRSVRNNRRVFLKNLSGFLEHCGTVVGLWKFIKQNNGTYETICDIKFKRNVIEIKSRDFEHYAEDVQFIYF